MLAVSFSGPDRWNQFKDWLRSHRDGIDIDIRGMGACGVNHIVTVEYQELTQSESVEDKPVGATK